MLHEIAHNWGLYDVYNTNLSPYAEVHAELIFNYNAPGYNIANNHGVYNGFEFVPSEYNCDGNPVYTYRGFNPESNIMGKWIPTNNEILEILNNGGDIFNEVQKRIMDIY